MCGILNLRKGIKGHSYKGGQEYVDKTSNIQHQELVMEDGFLNNKFFINIKKTDYSMWLSLAMIAESICFTKKEQAFWQLQPYQVLSKYFCLPLYIINAVHIIFRLADVAKDSFEDKDFLLGVLDTIMPEQYSSFSRSFENVVRDEDRSSCQKECLKCINL